MGSAETTEIDRPFTPLILQSPGQATVHQSCPGSVGTTDRARSTERGDNEDEIDERNSGYLNGLGIDRGALAARMELIPAPLADPVEEDGEEQVDHLVGDEDPA